MGVRPWLRSGEVTGFEIEYAGDFRTLAVDHRKGLLSGNVPGLQIGFQ